MKRFIFLNIIAILGFSLCFGQKAEIEGRCLNPKFEETVINYLSFDVPTLTVMEFKQDFKKFTIMDAREKEEFKTSHIPGAINVGYDKFDLDNYLELDKDKPIVVYCSIGYRSEKIAKILSDEGFNNVYNLFGSIFEWANRGNFLEDENGIQTQKVHTYSKSWSKWIDNPSIKKVY